MVLVRSSADATRRASDRALTRRRCREGSYHWWAGLVATLLPPPLVQADVAEPSTMVAQMPIAAGTLLITFAKGGFVAGVFTTS
jgi:hypothetical protein